MIGDKIKERRLQLGLTQDELAEMVGYKSRSAINKIELNTRDISSDKIVEFSYALKTTPLFLLGIDDDTPATVPVYEAAAGEGRINDGYPTEEYAIRLEPDQLVVRVSGRSMEPTLQDGDLVVVTAQNEVDRSRQIALVKVNGDEATLKRVEVNENGLTLVGDNTYVFPPHYYTAEQVKELPVRIEGVVTQLIRDMK